jgi:hypothetical protein
MTGALIVDRDGGGLAHGRATPLKQPVRAKPVQAIPVVLTIYPKLREISPTMR